MDYKFVAGVPELKPIKIESKEDLAKIANEMREHARSIRPIESKPNYPQDEEQFAEVVNEATSDAAKLARAMKMNRKIILGGELISVALSIDKYHSDSDQEFWHLSTGWLRPAGIKKTPDEVIEVLCEVFFDKPHEEIPCEGVMIPTIRHFISPV